MKDTNIFKTEDQFRESFFKKNGSLFDEKENNLMEFFWDFYDDLFMVIGGEVIGTVTNKEEEKLREQIVEQEEKEVEQIRIDEIDKKIPFYIEKAKTKIGKAQIGRLKKALNKKIRTDGVVIQTEMEFLYELLQDGYEVVLQNKSVYTGKKVRGSFTDSYKIDKGGIEDSLFHFSFNKQLLDFAQQLWKYHNKPVVDKRNLLFDEMIKESKTDFRNFIERGKFKVKLDKLADEDKLNYSEMEYLNFLLRKNMSGKY